MRKYCKERGHELILKCMKILLNYEKKWHLKYIKLFFFVVVFLQITPCKCDIVQSAMLFDFMETLALLSSATVYICITCHAVVRLCMSCKTKHMSIKEVSFFLYPSTLYMTHSFSMNHSKTLNTQANFSWLEGNDSS